jgi:hypothetical protein
MVLVIALPLLPSCGPRPRQVVSNPDPAGKVPAIEKAVQRHDTSVIPQLVKDLDSDDPAVRFYAIYGLRKLTSQDFGYEFFFDEDQRKPYVVKWQQWLSDWQARQDKSDTR